MWKPAEYTPATAEAFAQLFLHAGFPAGTFNMVLADGAETFAGLERALDEHLIDKIGFTGSTAVGRRIGEVCGRPCRRPASSWVGRTRYRMHDADLELAVEGRSSAGSAPPASGARRSGTRA